MGRIFILFSILFTAIISQAAQLDMYEDGAPVNSQPVALVIVGTRVVNGDVTVRLSSKIVPCASYPRGIDGDIYYCSTTRSQLAKYLNNEKLLSLNGFELGNWLYQNNVVISCNTNQKPQLINLQNSHVYDFEGSLANPK